MPFLKTLLFFSTIDDDGILMKYSEQENLPGISFFFF